MPRFYSPEHAIIEASIGHGPSAPLGLAEYATDVMNVPYTEAELSEAVLNLLNTGFLVMDPYKGETHNGLPWHTCSLNQEQWNIFAASASYFGFSK